MANITEEHLHHMAKRHHATMKIVDGMREKVAAHASKFFSTFETAGGAWVGGVIEGKSGGDTMLKVPYNLGLGAIALAVGHLGVNDKHLGPWSDHLNNFGNGLVGSYVAATGYAFGKRWKADGIKAAFGGAAVNPYAEVPTAVHGDLSEAQMAAIVSRMQAAAAAHG